MNSSPSHQIISKKHIGIIGGGVSGIAAAKAFKSAGHRITIFERAPSLGGVWNPQRSYPGVKTQSPKDLYQFTDLSMPEEFPEWPNGKQVLQYLDLYVEKHDLGADFRFGSSVVNMEELTLNDGTSNGWVLTVRSTEISNDDETDDVYKMTFDFIVISTGLFTNAKRICHAGQDKFEKSGGNVKHSSEYKDITEEEVKGKHVVVIGGSKSATDIAVHAASRECHQVSMVYRRNVWRIPYHVAGINFKHLLYMRAQEMQFTSWKEEPACGMMLSKIIACVTKPLSWLNFRMLEILLTVQLGLKKWDMVPKERIEDSVSIGLPVVTQGLMEFIRDGTIKPINTTIKCYHVNDTDEAKCMVLENGETINADIVIQATGWTTDLPFLPSRLRTSLIDESDGLYRLYRFAVNPKLPNIGFVGFNSSHCSVLSSEMIAHWLVRYVDGMLVTQNKAEEIEAGIEKLLEWKRRKSSPTSQGYHGGNHIAPFHFLHFDEILHDMGATIKCKAMITYPDASRYGKCLESAPRYQVLSELSNSREMPKGAQNRPGHESGPSILKYVKIE